MTSPTFPDAFPFPIQGDFADVALQAYELAMRIDAYARGADAAFQQIYKPKSFCYRVSVATATFATNSTNFWSNLVSEWDTSNTASPPSGASGWFQDVGEPQSWWIIGQTLMLTNVSGTPNTGDHVDGYFQWSGYDPLSNKPTGNPNVGFANAQEMNAGGESLSTVIVLPLYQASVYPIVQVFGAGTGVRAIAANSRLWGVRLGPVAL